MGLTAGSRLGAYEIQSMLGAGGMGEVYRARDTRLGRDVAIKILPQLFSTDPDRVARFEREAQALAALNHPHIAQIYGVEESGGVRGLVMELIDGPTLADRIAGGPIPIDEAIGIATEITEALEAAHEQGIIHRDLKPANIKVRSDGTVKVLDFGLAKVFESASSADAMNSPTLTAATQHGVILGTAAYMSPEQAKGRSADRRSDVWAFGCVFFEMLAGRRAFEGEDVSDTLAEVLKGQPDWDALPANVPRTVRTIIKQCLAKDRKTRIPEIAVVRFLLAAAGAHAGAEGHGDSHRPSARRSWMKAAVAPVVAALLAAVLTAAVFSRMRPPTHANVARLAVVLPPSHALRRPFRSVAVSPDGQVIVYAANRQLYLRRLSDVDVRPIEGTALDANLPFFSPDGRWIAFYAGAEANLKKVAVSGGAPVTISEISTPFGASWARNNQIVLADSQKGILRVSANGGTPDTIIRAEPGDAMEGPQLLPDGDHILFTVTRAVGASRWDQGQVVAQSLKSGKRKVLLEGGADARYVDSGHLIYALGTTVLAVPFDVTNLAVTGGPVPVVENVWRAPGTGLAHLDVAANGTLVFLLGSAADVSQSNLAFVDRQGARTALPFADGRYAEPRISPDGRQIAVLKLDNQGKNSIWIGDVSAGTSMRRLTFESVSSLLWSRDGRRIIFGSNRGGGTALFWQPADGSGSEERVTKPEPNDSYFPNSVSADGSMVAFFTNRNGGDISTVTLGTDQSPKPLISQRSHQDHASFSPDGRWVAYRSDESGQYEIFVQPFPLTGAKYQITTTGAVSPLWSPDGHQLFFVLDVQDTAGRLASVDVRTQPSFTFANPVKLPVEVVGAGSGVRPYDITPDGKQFLVTLVKSEVKPEPPQMRVALNWFDELKERVH